MKDKETSTLRLRDFHVNVELRGTNEQREGKNAKQGGEKVESTVVPQLVRQKMILKIQNAKIMKL